MAKLTKTQLRALKEVRAHLSMERCSFDHLSVRAEDGLLPKTEAEVTEFIRRRTRIWRQSWIYPLLDQLIADAEGAPVSSDGSLARIEKQVRGNASRRRMSR